MLFWTTQFSVLDSTFFVLDSTFWLDYTLKIDPDVVEIQKKHDKQKTYKLQTQTHHNCSSTAGVRRTIPTKFGMVIKKVRTSFALPRFFGMRSVVSR